MCAMMCKRVALFVSVLAPLSLGAMDLQKKAGGSSGDRKIFYYSPEQLLELAKNPYCLQRPDFLPNIPEVILSEEEFSRNLLSRIKELQHAITFTRRPRNKAYVPTIKALESVIGILDGRDACKREHAHLASLHVVVNKGFRQLCRDRRCPEWFRFKTQEMARLLDVALSKKTSARACELRGAAAVSSGLEPVLSPTQDKEAKPNVWGSQLFTTLALSPVSNDGVAESCDDAIEESDLSSEYPDQNFYQNLCEEEEKFKEVVHPGVPVQNCYQYLGEEEA